MRKIVTIGGGEIRTKETFSIDREIIRLSGVKNPKLLFIPTASSDSEGYWKNIKKYFGGYLHCKTDVLFLVKECLLKAEIKSKILSADIIYVGGGNTLMMIRLWKRLGIDKMLWSAYQKGTVLCGISAGSICWYEFGYSDSMSFYNPEKWKYINVKGLGFIKGIHCPHYDSATLRVPRKKRFQNMIQKIGGIGIAIDNNCAIEYIDGKYFKVIASQKHAAAYKVYKKSGKVVSEKIERKNSLTPIADLYKRSNVKT